MKLILTVIVLITLSLSASGKDYMLDPIPSSSSGKKKFCKTFFKKAPHKKSEIKKDKNLCNEARKKGYSQHKDYKFPRFARDLKCKYEKFYRKNYCSKLFKGWNPKSKSADEVDVQKKLYVKNCDSLSNQCLDQHTSGYPFRKWSLFKNKIDSMKDFYCHNYIGQLQNRELQVKIDALRNLGVGIKMSHAVTGAHNEKVPHIASINIRGVAPDRMALVKKTFKEIKAIMKKWLRKSSKGLACKNYDALKITRAIKRANPSRKSARNSFGNMDKHKNAGAYVDPDDSGNKSSGQPAADEQ